MADIDDEIEQGRAHYLSDGQSIPNTLTQEAFKKGFPVVGGRTHSGNQPNKGKIREHLVIGCSTSSEHAM